MAYSFRGGGASDSRSGYSFRPRPRRRSSPRTTRQQLEILRANAFAEKKGKSLLGQIVSGGGHGLGAVLRQLMRPSHAVAEGARRGLEGEGFDISDAVKGASRGFQLKKNTTFSDVFKQEGLLKGHGHIRALAGFGADIVTDPLNLVTLGTATPLAAGLHGVQGAAKAVKAAEEIRRAITVARPAERARLAERAYKEVAQAGPAFSAHRSLGSQLMGYASRGPEVPLTEHESALLTMSFKDAQLEASAFGPSRVQVKLALPFMRGRSLPLSPVEIAGLKTAPRVPSLRRVATGESVASRLPGAQRMATSLGRAFKHGFLEEEWARPALVSQHFGEQIYDKYLHRAMTNLSPFKSLPEEDVLKSLKWAEEQKSQLIRGKAREMDNQVLERGIAEGSIDERGAEFLRRWHDYWEHVRIEETTKAGIKYDKALDKIYVPHIYTKRGGVVTESALARANFSKERQYTGSIAQLMDIKNTKGLSEDIETDIWRLLTTRTRRSAIAQGKSLLTTHMRLSHGIPSVVPDLKKLDKLEGQINKTMDYRDNAVVAGKDALAEKYDARIGRYLDDFEGAYTKNKDIPAGFVAAKIGKETFHFHPDLHAAMTRVERVLNDDEHMGNIAGTARKLLAHWKIGVTSINPGYRVRNTTSDIWNMYLDGMPTPRILQYGMKAGALQKRAIQAGNKLARGEKLTVKETQDISQMAEAYNAGVLSGLFGGDIQTVASMIKSGHKARAFLNPLNPRNVLGAKALVKGLQDFNRHGENWGRLTHYLYRRDQQRLGPFEAAEHVKRAHFDYTELTPFEREKMKLLFPFYTWTRKNVPFQLERLVARPGRFATFPKMMQTANELATGDNETPGIAESIMPSWMKEKYAFRIPGKNAYLIPGIGATDLAKLEHPSEFIQMGNPAFKLAWEVSTGRSSLTGEKISGQRRKPISDEAAAILSFIPGANVGRTERVVRGKRISGKGANPWLSYIAGQLPLSNYLVNKRSNIKQAQQGTGRGDVAYLGGFSSYERDLAAEEISAKVEFADYMNDLMRSLRDEGTFRERKRSKNSNYQLDLSKTLRGG